MRKWFTDNLVLATGIVLPMILIGAFFILNNAPKLLTEPPKHDFVMVTYSYDHLNPSNYFLAFEVNNGRLIGKAIPHKQSNSAYRQKATVLRYNAATNAFTELIYELPDDVEDIDQSTDLTVFESEHLTLDKRKQSPDGFSLEFVGYRGGGGLLGELFGTRGRYASSYILRKGDAVFELPNPTPSIDDYSNDLEFMGWVTGEDRGQ